MSFAGKRSYGYQQLTVDNTSGGVALTIPAGADFALMRLSTASIRWRSDGTNPTASVGMPMNANDVLEFDGNLAAFKAIRQGSTSGVLDIEYYGVG